MEVYGVVYLIVNMVNGKRYVGQTVQPLKKRFSAHTYADSLLGKAIRKYGAENFRYGVIKSCASKAELDAAEKHFIAALNCKAPCGYNLTDGGEGGLSGFSPSAETRAKMSASRTGKKNPQYGKTRSLEHCANISASKSGEKNPNYGKSLSAEHRANISAAKCGRKFKPHSPEHRAQLSAKQRGYSPFKNLLNELDAHQLSYVAFAKLLNLSDTSVSRKMRCKQKFTDKDEVKLEEIFGKPAEYLLQRDDE